MKRIRTAIRAMIKLMLNDNTISTDALGVINNALLIKALREEG